MIDGTAGRQGEDKYGPKNQRTGLKGHLLVYLYNNNNKKEFRCTHTYKLQTTVLSLVSHLMQDAGGGRNYGRDLFLILKRRTPV